MLLFVFLLTVPHCLYGLLLAKGWEYLNIHCRDNSNDPVDWWYMYKPPSNVGPKLDSGINFSYITPEVAGRWTPSKKHIFSNSMLRHTLMPMYNSDYTQYMALLVYNEQQASGEFKGSASLGIMMANEMGGVWVGHTVPGFPDLTKAGPTFPSTEIKNGHILMCLSMDLITLNNMAIAIKQTEPAIKRMFIPEKMKNYLPEWENLVGPGSDPSKMSKTTVKKAKLLHFVTRGKSLRGLMLARSPGDSRCLYKSFAKTKHIVMDVYGHAEHTNIICDKKYSLRNINSISIKYPEQVYYINNKTDSMGFAVSTAARWQRTGNRKPQYWTCTGNIENQPLTAKGGIIACVNNYNVWLTFDNLKVKEPDCGFIVQ